MLMNNAFYGNNTYGSLPYYNQPFQTPNQQNTFSTTLVSDIAEVMATKPDVTGKPLFFYNVANEEVYKKQYDNTGIAPIKTYKLVVNNEQEKPINPFDKSFKTLNDKLDNIAKLLTPEIIEEVEKRGRKNA